MNRTVPPPLVERVVEGPDYWVELTWSAADVLPAILSALGSSGFLLAQATRYRQSQSPEARAEALARLASDHRVQDAFTFRLHPDAGDSLELALSLNLEPETCRRDGCGDLEEGRTGLCAGHLEALDQRAVL